MSTHDLLAEAQGYAAAYLEDVVNRHVGGTVDRKTLIERLGGPLPEASSNPHVVLANLVRDADPGIVATRCDRRAHGKLYLPRRRAT